MSKITLLSYYYSGSGSNSSRIPNPKTNVNAAPTN
jgi:hypothetical protein